MTLPDPPAWAREIFTVGVTGTNGKTTTTTFVARALASDGRPVAWITSLGAFIGERRVEVAASYDGFVDLMRQAREAGTTRAAIELTSEALAAGFARAWPCSVAVLTSFDRDHLDAHGSAEHYLASKAQLFVALPPGGTAVLNARARASDLVAEVVPAHARTVHFSLDDATAVTPTWSGTRFELSGRKHSIRALGAPFVEDSLAALSAAVASGVDAERAALAIAECAPPPGRFELVAERPWVVVDYAHTPAAVAATLATARQLCGGRLCIVLGAGGDRDPGKRAPMGAAARAADRVIVTRDNPRSEDPRTIADQILAGLGAHPGVSVELDRERAITVAIRSAAPDDVVVLAGRGHESEPLSDAEIARRAHPGGRRGA